MTTSKARGTQLSVVPHETAAREAHSPWTGAAPRSGRGWFRLANLKVEAAIFLPNTEKSSKAALLAHARKLCDDWRATIVVKR